MGENNRRQRALKFAINMPRVASAAHLNEVTDAIDRLMADWDEVQASDSTDLQEQVLGGAFALLIRNEPDEFDDAALARFASDARELMAAFVAPSASQPLAGGL